MKQTLLILFGTLITAAATDFDIRNAKEFSKCVPKNAKVQKLAGDMKFTEGPVWVPQGAGYLIFSDIPANELKRWTAKEGLVTYRKPSNNANGNTIDSK